MSSNLEADSPNDQKGGTGRPLCFRSTFEECIFVLTATLAIAQGSIFQGAVMVATAAIGRDLNMNTAEITWITAGSSLTGGAFLLSFGKLADMFGRKKLFVLAMAGFTISLLIAGFANNAIFLDTFSGVLGLFSAAAVPPAVGSLGAVYEKPSKRKNFAFACFSAGNPIGFVVGMIITGIASKAYSWRASFWALAVIYAIFTGLTIWAVPADSSSHRVSFSALKQFDILGTILIVAGFGCVSTSLSLAGGAPQGWGTSYVIALLVIGVILLIGFLIWQYIATHPLMPLYVWKDRTFSLLMIIFCLCYMAFTAGTFFLSLYMQEINHYSPLEMTARLLPMVIGGTLTNVVCALILHRINNNILMGISACAFLGCFLTLSFMNEQAPYWTFTFPALVLSVIGMDMQFNVANLYVMSSLPPNQQSTAGGIFNTVNKLWSNIGLGISTSIYSSLQNSSLDETASIRPYLGVYWFAAACVGVGTVLVPFLKLGKQGVSTDDEDTVHESVDIIETPKTG